LTAGSLYYLGDFIPNVAICPFRLSYWSSAW